MLSKLSNVFENKTFEFYRDVGLGVMKQIPGLELDSGKKIHHSNF